MPGRCPEAVPKGSCDGSWTRRSRGCDPAITHKPLLHSRIVNRQVTRLPLATARPAGTCTCGTASPHLPRKNTPRPSATPLKRGKEQGLCVVYVLVHHVIDGAHLPVGAFIGHIQHNQGADEKRLSQERLSLSCSDGACLRRAINGLFRRDLIRPDGL